MYGVGVGGSFHRTKNQHLYMLCGGPATLLPNSQLTYASTHASTCWERHGEPGGGGASKCRLSGHKAFTCTAPRPTDLHAVRRGNVYVPTLPTTGTHPHTHSGAPVCAHVHTYATYTHILTLTLMLLCTHTHHHAQVKQSSTKSE